ncbi:uncharacterized protein FIBRA_00364 [Fibroporia radiculosa]|uniref:DUF1857 domain-containing protein n=1 Tax=Fibroporia radiculosa TaxID=599839 RepID=J7S615_9APHY|nr:uncharacterized protein FIBRA_00364 [Fibroporia radiculosa]CCL98369.1 predicted protein [Fibroporia radiculosa]
MRLVATTLPVNPPSETLHLTEAQLYQGLISKARDPIRFVKQIQQCRILSEHESGLRREIVFTGRPEAMLEDVEYFPPGLVMFTMTSPTSNDRTTPQARITNLISHTPDGGLFLTFSFAFGPNGQLDKDSEADTREREVRKAGEETVAHTLAVVRELVQSGQIKA